MLPCQKFEPIVLQFIGVLEFVHQDVVETVLVVSTQDLVTLQHFITTQHEFGKICYPFLPTQMIVFGIAFNQALLKRVAGMQYGRTQTRLFLRVDEAL